MNTIQVIDSHTEGEPTRVVVESLPKLGRGSMRERLERAKTEWEPFRRAVVCEPRGHDVIVGALLCEPVSPEAAAGVIFFNNTGYLGMCGHGTIGVAVTLAHLGRIRPGRHRIETPVGDVSFKLEADNRVAVRNVPSHRHLAAVRLEVPALGTVVGDVAWGGNWFFLVDGSPLPLLFENAGDLARAAGKVRAALVEAGITGVDGAEIDHIEFLAPPHSPGADARNFVLCPGGAYDRSPCGTGTSAKLACLAADGKLKPGETFTIESIIGSRFSATYQLDGEGRCQVELTGRAFVTAESTLVFAPGDPFRLGLPL